MKVKFFGVRTQGLNWRLINEPFAKIQVDIIFGKNKRARAFIPLTGGLTQLQDGMDVVLASNDKGTKLLRPAKVADGNVLVFLTVEGGFRGGVSIYSNTGEIIAQASASAACESAIAMVVALEDRQEVVIKEYGRYGTFYHCFINDAGNPIKNKYCKEDFEYLYGA